MLCERCGEDFDRSVLRPPSLPLRLVAAPFFFLMKSRVVRGEVNALYCPPCRRQLNVCFMFIAFLVVVSLTVYLLQRLGFAGGGAA